jgi:hypothetical protein
LIYAPRAAGLFAVQLLPRQPLALIPVNGEKNEIGGEIVPKMAAARDPGVARR